jgi:hypothetical protein
MWEDLTRGRIAEVDELNRIIVDLATAHGRDAVESSHRRGGARGRGATCGVADVVTGSIVGSAGNEWGVSRFTTGPSVTPAQVGAGGGLKSAAFENRSFGWQWESRTEVLKSRARSVYLALSRSTTDPPQAAPRRVAHSQLGVSSVSPLRLHC